MPRLRLGLALRLRLRLRRTAAVALAAAAGAASLAGPADAALPDPGTAAANLLSGASGLLPHSIRPAGSLSATITGATRLGPAALASPARALIALRHRDQAGLERLIAAVSDPRSPEYGHYLTPEQFVARFAPTPATVAAVARFATGAGLRVVSVPVNRAYVEVAGPVAAINRAFGTRIDSFTVAGQLFEAPARAVHVPAALAGAVLSVDGLDTAQVKTPRDTPPPPAFVNAPPLSAYWAAHLDTSVPGAYGQKALPDVIAGYTPQQIQGGYGIAGAIASGLDGRGQTVAVIDAYSSPTIAQDAATWSANHGLPAPKLTVIDTAAERNALQAPTLPTDTPIVGGLGIQDPQGWFGEETLDVEAVHATAPGAAIVMHGAASPQVSDLEMAQNDVVAHHQAQIISNSYGGSADTTNPTSDGYWQQAAATGIGVYFSSGDNGDGTAGGTQPANRTVDGDGNSPFVTSVGGTTLAVGAQNNYLFETYWGTDNAALSNGAWGTSTFQSGGGGGTSQVYSEPDYQKKAVPSRFANYWKGNPNAQTDLTGTPSPVLPGRVVPDVAMVGDTQSGFLMGITQDFSAYKNPLGYDLPGDAVKYNEYRIGGTSLSSPLFAGVMALADQAAGRPHGFANPALYGLAGTAAFHDVTAPASKVAVVRTNFTNNVNADGGTAPFLRTTGDVGTLASVPGYDDSTGLGTPNGVKLLAGLAPGSPLLAHLKAAGGGTGTAGGSVSGRPRRNTARAARVLLVSCTTQKRRNGGRTRVCRTRTLRTTAVPVGRLTGSLVRGRVTYATGSERGGRLVLRARRTVTRGRYTLVLQTRAGRRTVTARRAATV